MKWWKSETRDYHHTERTSCLTNYLTSLDVDLRKWGNFKVFYLSFHGLNDSGTLRFELVTRGFELALLNFNLCFYAFST